MFICVCTGLDEKTLEQMRKDGVDTLKKIIDTCGAGGDCGSCAFKINRYLKDNDTSENDYVMEEIKKAD